MIEFECSMYIRTGKPQSETKDLSPGRTM